MFDVGSLLLLVGVINSAGSHDGYAVEGIGRGEV